MAGLVPAFQFNLGQKVGQGKACIGKLDGENPSLACATTGGKILVHSPHAGETSQRLNVNKEVTALASGSLEDGSPNALLFIGTGSDVLAFDVHNNQDRFFKEAPDGANCLCVGPVSRSPHPAAIVGGNCSIQGFDAQGNERLYHVTEDNVTAMARCDANGDGLPELLAGTEDGKIIAFGAEDAVGEVVESGAPVGIAPLGKSRFAVALGGGTIVVYNRLRREWRAKSKGRASALCAFDIDGDGVNEIISGWQSGRLEAWRPSDGAVVCKHKMAGPIVKLLTGDYRGTGSEELIAVTADGDVAGFQVMEAQSEGASTGAKGKSGPEVGEDVVKLTQQKKELLHELSKHEEMLKNTEKGKKAKKGEEGAEKGELPVAADTSVEARLEMNLKERQAEVAMRANEEVAIKGVIAFNEQLFHGEAKFIQPSVERPHLRLPLTPDKDIEAELHLHIMVGRAGRSGYTVVKRDFRLPKFAMYMAVEERGQEPQAWCAFRLEERAHRVAEWIDASFATSIQSAGSVDSFDIGFVDIRSDKPLVLRMNVQQPGLMEIHCDSMELAGEIVQDLALYLGLTELTSRAHFPAELDRFHTLLTRVEEHNNIRGQLTAGMADSVNAVKALIVRAEDSRSLGDSTSMRSAYNQLLQMNRELAAEHAKRVTNHSELSSSLREVNQMIQRAAKLRVGSAKSSIVSACRAAISDNNLDRLFSIIRSGASS